MFQGLGYIAFHGLEVWGSGLNPHPELRGTPFSSTVLAHRAWQNKPRITSLTVLSRPPFASDWFPDVTSIQQLSGPEP